MYGYRKCRLLGGLEGHTLLGLEGNTELEKSHDNIGEIVEEGVIVLGVPLDVGLEALVLDQGHVGGQHHKSLGGDILELLGAVPLLVRPLLLHEKLVVVVGEDGRGEGPGARETGAVSVAAAESVGTRESDDLLVVEAHAVEDGAEVLLLLGSVRETTVGSAVRDVTVVAAGSPGDLGALHLLDGGNTSKGPEIGVGDPGELLLNGVEEVTGSVKTSVGAVVTLRGESHGSTVATAYSSGQYVATAFDKFATNRSWSRHRRCHWRAMRDGQEQVRKNHRRTRRAQREAERSCRRPSGSPPAWE